MIIRLVVLKRRVEEKIFRKHRIYRRELVDAMLGFGIKIFKVKEAIYMAIAKNVGYITIIFKYDKGKAVIKTAYKSSEWQKRLYKRK